MSSNWWTSLHVWQALYPVDNTNWCIYALFINDIHRIKKNCVLKTLNRTTNLAYSLDGYLWAISALASEKLQIRCVDGNTCCHNSPTVTDCRYR